jgi:NAD(P)-dependent dehydrogenase (short-subunit alcohol dehydrogenase family)
VAARGDRRVAVVTGGGAGIGAAIAEELGRRGDFVVTMDPLVTLDGTEQLPPAEETTAGRIVAAGGMAEASAVSVTDGKAVSDLFHRLVADHGRLDAVINVAGITRPTSFATGIEEDWAGVLTVHLEGYLNVLDAALPLMAAAGHGRILGVTSGSGWRPADAGAYACAKRAVAALTWTLGPLGPPGVTVNALSPIAVTRMVIEAARRARERAATGAAGPTSGGMSFGSMPEPHELGPLAAHMVSDESSWCRGRVVFAGGAEVAVVEPPRLLEVVRTGGVASLASVLDALVPKAFAMAEAQQVSGGGSNPRFGGLFAEPPAEVLPSDVRSCLIVSDRPVLASAVGAALGARGVEGTIVPAESVGAGFEGATGCLSAVGPVDAVVVGLAATPGSSGTGAWEQVLAEHAGIAAQLCGDAAWARAVADHAAGTQRSMRLLTLTDAETTGGRSRAQAVAQLARVARSATDDRVAMFAVSSEAPLAYAADAAGVSELVAHLVCAPDAPALSGAELVAGSGWVGLRSHPRPAGSITLGGSEVPDWFDTALRGIL